MVKAVVLYGPPEDPDAFERYYADTHTALAQRIPGLQRFEAGRGFATPDGSAVPYQRIAELTFEDMDALQAGLGSEEGQAAVNDIPNFATRRRHDLLRRDRLTPSRVVVPGRDHVVGFSDSRKRSGLFGTAVVCSQTICQRPWRRS
jgi:uncharacterized protein (TIGR02118 family)